MITFDHRGTGASDEGEERAYKTCSFARAACAVLDSAGVTCAHVYGHSMGGRVAQWLALDAPTPFGSHFKTSDVRRRLCGHVRHEHRREALCRLSLWNIVCTCSLCQLGGAEIRIVRCP
nr:alpha/beta hydrolase [Pseudarthrobacter albicanus]